MQRLLEGGAHRLAKDRKGDLFERGQHHFAKSICKRICDERGRVPKGAAAPSAEHDAIVPKRCHRTQHPLDLSIEMGALLSIWFAVPTNISEGCGKHTDMERLAEQFASVTTKHDDLGNVCGAIFWDWVAELLEGVAE